MAINASGAAIFDLEGRAARAPGSDHHLGRREGREGRLQALHAQGDLRAAARDHRHPARAAAARGARRRSGRLRDRSARPAADRCCSPAAPPTTRPGRQVPHRVDLARCPARWIWPASFATAIRWWGPPTWSSPSPRAGETADTLAAVREARARGARVLAICNVVDSAIPRGAERRALHPRRAGDRRRLDQVLHRPAGGAGAARGAPRAAAADGWHPTPPPAWSRSWRWSPPR